MIVGKFCWMVRLHLQKLFMQFSSEPPFMVLTKEFEALHGIPHIIGAIDRSHIPIQAPIIGGEDYYYRKSFHFTLLQGIVDTKCVSWDYDFGWVGSMYDWIFSNLQNLGRCVLRVSFCHTS
jgi:hypothetical protein